MGTVLGGMRNVRWHELQHAYGSASQVPGMLSRVAWGDGPTAGDALDELARWIGAPAVFDATVAAVPFLWELAGTETVKDRAGVLDLHDPAARRFCPNWDSFADITVAIVR
ncbi:hypothetical protein ABZ943_39750, partial [Streptomyces rubiginosohelvolus]